MLHRRFQVSFKNRMQMGCCNCFDSQDYTQRRRATLKYALPSRAWLAHSTAPASPLPNWRRYWRISGATLGLESGTEHKEMIGKKKPAPLAGSFLAGSTSARWHCSQIVIQMPGTVALRIREHGDGGGVAVAIPPIEQENRKSRTSSSYQKIAVICRPTSLA